MLKMYKNRRGQASLSEYVFIFFIVVGVMSLMSIYMRRALQAKIFDARNAMVRTVKTRTAGVTNATILPEYEPYYVNRLLNRQNIREKETRLIPALGGSIYRKNVDEYTRIKIISETLPPVNADQEFGP